ncbi:MAG: two-component regulator propeller domain-containing protein [Chitinophagaceae bacterium]
MTRRTVNNIYFILVVFTGIVFLSCNSSASIPFPEKELGFTQPEAMPLQFTGEKKLIFDTATKGGVKPVIRPLDLNALPSAVFDSNGFRNFTSAPEQRPFDLNALPDTVFSPDKLKVQSLQFKTHPLNPTPPVKASPLAAQRGNTLAIFDFGPKLGMPATFVTSLLKDKNGLLWIGSREGLFRYDGVYVQTILGFNGGYAPSGLAEDSQGRIWFIDQQRIGMIDMQKGTVSYSTARMVPVNNLSKIIRDTQGRIWISKTTARDVLVIDPVTQTFKTLDRSTGLPDVSGANDITQDSTGKIWITTPLQGTAIVDWKAGKIRYLKKANGLLNDSSRAITTDNTGKVWIAVVGGVQVVDTKANSIKLYTVAHQGLKPAFTGDISADNKGQIWIGKSVGLEVLDPENNRLRFIDDAKGLSAKWVSSCTLDNNNRMWVSTIGGLHVIDQHAETIHPLGTTNVISLMEDTVGNLWVATQKGVQLIDPRKKIVHYLDKTQGLGSDFVQSFVKFKQQMWVTSNGGLDIVDPINKTLEHMGKKEGLINDTVYVAYKDKGGNTWLTGPSNGIDLIDSAKTVILHTDIAGGLADDNIQDVKEDADGLVWLAGSTGGINVINLQKRTVQYLNNQPGLRDTCTKVMIIDKYARIWIGTDRGIYVVDKKAATITPITTSNGLSHNRITSLLLYNGSVIAGTDKKVNIITAPVPGSNDSATNKWHVVIANKSEGLLREATNAWATDAIDSKGQYLWGDNGITVINKIEPSRDTVTTAIAGINLMTKPQYFTNDYALKEHDTVWAADTFYVKGQPPAVAGFASRKELQWDSVSGIYNMPGNLQIPYDQNYLQFHFGQLLLHPQDATLYTYMLEGIDKNWSALTTSTATENYLNLPSGYYAFKVSSKGEGGQWSEPAVFRFRINPPWYKTWWAYTLLAILCAILLRAYIVYRSRRLLKENKILEEKISLRTKQLQQSIEDLKATQTQLIQSEKMASLGELTAGIAHEIQNPLNFINNFAEVNTELIADLKEEIARGNMEEVKSIAANIEANEQKINHHGKRADSIVKGMLQHSRTGKAQKEAVNINQLTDEYLRLAYHGLRAKDKSFNALLKTDYDESLDKVNIIAQDMGRVILNLITNAFYAVGEKQKTAADQVSGDKYAPTVSVSTRKTGDKVEIQVKDNGSGIPQKILDKIFQPFFTTKPTGQGTGLGLSMAYDIVKAHQGTLHVETNEGIGTVFTIELPAT